MKKAVIAVLFAAVGSMAIAGGDNLLAECGDNAKKPCQQGGVYIDYDKNLMWQDEPYGDIEDGAYSHNRSAGKAGRWSYAKNYCSSLIYAGYDDWRLPMVGELADLFYKTRGLKHTLGTDFWTSTPSEGSSYWSVYGVVRGQPHEQNKRETVYIRCVRCLDEKR